MSDYTKKLEGQEQVEYIKEHFKSEETPETQKPFTTEPFDYQKQGTDFLTDTKTKIKVEFVEHNFYFDDDKEARDIYRITLTRNGKQYSFKFGQSIASTGTEPTAYDVLACLTQYDPHSFEDFCSNYGYDIDSRKAEKTYKMVQKEFKGVYRLFGDVMEKLQEIQ